MTRTITVLIVDDSAMIRGLLTQLLSAQPDMKVVGTAEDPFDAREKIKQLKPDVLTLDVEMPKMDGLSFLEKIMALRPMPVVMVSTLTGKGTDIAVAALALGAVECIAKPIAYTQADLESFARELSDKIRIAAGARIRARQATNPVVASKPSKPKPNAPMLIAIGASTGGVEALGEVITQLPNNMPPIVITQHMPAGFTSSFAKRLSGLCELGVVEGSDRMKLQTGLVVIAPGGKHMEIARDGNGFYCKITDGIAVNNHKPSVDVLFDSVTALVGAQALGIILTGMGKDGAQGLLRLRQSGAHTIGQDEASCVVYGMPRYAAEIGAVIEVQPLHAIATAIKNRCLTIS